MHGNLPEIAGLSGGIIGMTANIPYLRDIFKHKTKPERAMWWVYSFLFIILFIAQYSTGVRWVLFITGEYIISCILIASLSIKYGYGKFHRRDLISAFIAALGIIAWAVTNQPIIAILIVIVVDFAGFWLTIVKTWHAPHTETLISWEISLVAAALGVISVDSISFKLIIYPLYAMVSIALLVWVIIYRRKKVRTDPEDF